VFSCFFDQREKGYTIAALAEQACRLEAERSDWMSLGFRGSYRVFAANAFPIQCICGKKGNTSTLLTGF